ncbi:PRC-barrel domain-containing protein, partial [Francisella tularensis subsp. holarctica]|uniref:PRC-barrel domain-containing protein n=1 Tax=Francisella tularensis TaxID=263 RepID=UPI0023819662
MKQVMEDLILSSTSLIGDDLVNYNGENLGEVKDIMLDTNTGEVAYVVVSFGGFLGMGVKLFAVP